MTTFNRIDYKSLNARQQENFNFQKVAGKLADYGYNCLRLNDDWQGADFIACHIDGDQFVKVQLKGRFSFEGKYEGKDIHIAFFNQDDCYVYPHDEVLEKTLSLSKIKTTISWNERKSYSWSKLPKWARQLLEPYKV